MTFHGASLPQFKAVIAMFLALSLIINFGPLLVFVVKLAVTKRKGLLQYGAMAAAAQPSLSIESG